MNLRDLQYFAVVARHGSVTRASEELDLSPPALSKGLKRLQDDVGVRLVERSGKGIRLTTAGQALLSRAHRLGLAFRDVENEVRDIGEGRLAHLRVGTTNDQVLARVVAKLVQASSQVSVELEVSNNDLMIPRLVRGELDLVFNAAPQVPFAGTEQERIGEDRFVAFGARGHRLAGRRRVSLEQVANERWALPTRDLVPRQAWEGAFRTAGLPMPTIAFETRLMRPRMIVVAESPLLGLVGERTLSMSAVELGLARIHVPQLEFGRTFWAIRRKGGYLPPAGEKLVALVREAWARRA